MKPSTHEEIQAAMLEWADVLEDDNYTVMVGFDSDGPIILIKAKRQGNVLQWCL